MIAFASGFGSSDVASVGGVAAGGGASAGGAASATGSGGGAGCGCGSGVVPQPNPSESEPQRTQRPQRLLCALRGLCGSTLELRLIGEPAELEEVEAAPRAS